MQLLPLLLLPIHGYHVVGFGFAGGPSHHYIAGELLKELAGRGNQATLVVASFDLNATGDLEGVTKVGYDAGTSYGGWYQDRICKISTLDPLSGTLNFMDWLAVQSKQMLIDPTLKEYFKKNPVDYALVDTPNSGSLMYADYVGAKNVVAVSSVSWYDPILSEPFGVPNSVAFIPQYGSEMSTTDGLPYRLKNAIVYYANLGAEAFLFARPQDQLRSQYSSEFKTKRTYHDAAAAVSLILWPLEFGIDFVRPLSPKVKAVGPLLATAGKPLSAEYDGFLRSLASKGQVALVSFGTLLDTCLSQEEVEHIHAVFAAVPEVNFLWKLKGKAPKSVAKNVQMLSGYIPQNDLLADPRVTLFVGHGGINGVGEAAFHGKVYVGLPKFADQLDNVNKVVAHGWGLAIPKGSSVGDMASMLKGAATSPALAAKAAQISKITKAQQKAVGGVKGAADWAEYGFEVGGEHLALPIGHGPLGGPLVLDCAVCVAWLVIGYLMMQCGKRCCCGKRAKQKKA